MLNVSTGQTGGSVQGILELYVNWQLSQHVDVISTSAHNEHFNFSELPLTLESKI